MSSANSVSRKNVHKGKGSQSARRKALLDAAIEYAELGIPVLPVHSVDSDGKCTCGDRDCTSPGKHPATAHGLKDATTDLDQVKRWWKKSPHNIGAVPGKGEYVVLDVDPWKEGEDDRLERLLAEHGDLQETLVIASGDHDGTRGHHYWYRNSEGLSLPNKVEGIDVRSGQAYVLMPPSRHVSGVEYEIECGTFGEVADLPGWLASAGRRQEPQTEVRGARQVTGIPVGKRALKTIDAGFLPEPRDGHSQRDEAVAFARNLIESGTDRGLARGLFEKVLLDPRSSLDPDRPWSRQDATSIFSSVAWNPAPDQGEFIVSASRADRFKVRDLADAVEISQQELDWVIPNLLAAGEKAVLAGPPKSLKTWMALQAAKAVAEGVPFLGVSEWAPEPDQAVLVIEEEGAAHRWADRLLKVFENHDVPINYVHRSGLNLQDDKDVDLVIEIMVEREIRLLIVDPWQRVTAGIKENDAADTAPAWDALHRIVTETGAALLLLHHTKKGGGTPEMDSIRGSSRMAGEVDFMIVLNKDAPGELTAFLDGRDLDLEAETNHIEVVYPTDSPWQMKLAGFKLNLGGKASRTKHAILEVLGVADAPLSTREVSELVIEDLGKSISRQAVNNALDQLAESGQVSRISQGQGKANLWEITE